MPADLEIVKRRALDDGDPAALKILGYVYASGWGAAIDYGRAYEYYGRAYMRARRTSRPISTGCGRS